MSNNLRKAFVVQSIGNVGSDTRKRADDVLRPVIEPACEAAGYQAVRADKLLSRTIAEPIISALSTHPLVFVRLHLPKIDDLRQAPGRSSPSFVERLLRLVVQVLRSTDKQ